MEKESKWTYDAAMARVEEIIRQLENSEAIGLQEYKKLSQEAQKLLSFCRVEITKLEEQLAQNAQ